MLIIGWSLGGIILIIVIIIIIIIRILAYFLFGLNLALYRADTGIFTRGLLCTYYVQQIIYVYWVFGINGNSSRRSAKPNASSI